MKNFKKWFTVSVAGMILMFVSISAVHAVDPAQTAQPDKANITIKGRLTTPAGQGIPGLKVGGSDGYSPLTGLSQACYAGQTLGVTDSNGYYTLIVYVKTDPPCRAAFDSITPNMSRLRWRNQNGDLIDLVGGYDIKPK
jgi:hypothetical protein